MGRETDAHMAGVSVVTSPAEIEEILTPLLDHAAKLSFDAMRLIDELLDPDCTFGTMPDAVIYRLHLAATSTYRGGIFCLRVPETSVNAYSLLRGLIEAWSHLEFIADASAGGEIGCRALRYEMGATHQWSNVLHAAPSYFDKGAWLLGHDDKKQELQKLWGECGCSGRLRSYSDVEQTLKVPAARQGMEWVHGVWRSSSATVHMYGTDFLLATKGDTTRLVWALPSHRAPWLAFLVSAYSFLSITALKILNEDDSRIVEFHERGRVLAEEPLLRQIAGQMFDDDYSHIEES